MALDTVYTSPTYNSFFSIAEITAFINIKIIYFPNDGNWSQLTDTDKEKYILAAVEWINKIKWKGNRHSGIVVPIMSWPREGIYFITGEEAVNTTTPNSIGRAMACYILHILHGSMSQTAAQATGAIKSKTVGKVSIQYDVGVQAYSGTPPQDSCLINNVESSWYYDLVGAAKKLGTVPIRRHL